MVEREIAGLISITQFSIKNDKIIGYKKYGRSVNKQNALYPLCRPTVKISKDTDS